jgi:homoserine acetyltransferase
MIEGQSHSIKHESNQLNERQSLTELMVMYTTAGTVEEADSPATLTCPNFRNHERSESQT